MRKGGKGEMGETFYIIIIPLVFGWCRLRECVLGGSGGGVGGLRAQERSLRAHIKPGCLIGGVRVQPGVSRSFPGSTLSLSITPPFTRASTAQEDHG